MVGFNFWVCVSHHDHLKLNSFRFSKNKQSAEDDSSSFFSYFVKKFKCGGSSLSHTHFLFRCGRISAASSSSLSSLSHPLSHTVLTSPYLTNDLSAHIPPVYRSPNITAITLPHQHHDRREFPSITCRLYSTDYESIRTPGDPLLSAALNI